jgi:hypothetical protein
MATVLFLNAEGPSWWEQQGGVWCLLPGPASGPVWVVTDLTEETLVEIAVPRIFGNDRSRFVQRQLANRFPESQFRTALSPILSGSLMNRLAPPKQILMAIEPADRLTAAMASVQTPVVGVWSVSVLLAQMGQAKSLPGNLLIVLGQAASTRIVFLKDHTPVLTRLVAGSNSAAEQALEVVRTVRHLENTHVIERGSSRLAVLLLGTHPGLETVLSRDRIEAVAPPIARWADPDGGWRDALFDRVCKSPPGQLAPLALRSSHLTQQVQKAAGLAMAVSVLAALAVASGSVVSIVGDRGLRAGLNTTSSQLAVQITQLDLSLASFGVSPELLRKVLALDTDEIESVPALHSQLVALSRAIASVPNARVRSLQWQLVGPQTIPCALDSTIATVAAVAVANPAAEPARKVELKLSIALGSELGPRLLLQKSTQLSDQLKAIPGASVLLDPSRTLRDGDIGSASAEQGDALRQFAWCLMLPGAIKNETEPVVSQ